MEFIDLKRQYAHNKKRIDEAISKVVSSGRFILGQEVSNLEKILAEFIGTSYGIGVASGTDALMLALMALKPSKGAIVLTSAFSFFATAEVIAFLGLKPVFVDINPTTFNMDTACLQETITSLKAKGEDDICAIMPVSLYGLCAEMDKINEIAKKIDCPVIEDGCQSFGATYKGTFSCNLSTFGVTSFFPSKPLGCYGDGGMVFTNDQELASAIKMLRVHGSRQRYLHEEIGVNSRLDSIQAAILNAKMSFFPKEIQLRQEVAQRYFELLEPLAEDGLIEFQVIPDYSRSIFAQFTIAIKNSKRDEVARSLNKDGIPTAIHYPRPLPLQPAMEKYGFKKGMFPNAEKAASEVLSLPMHPYLEIEEQLEVANSLFNAFGKTFKK